MNAMTATNPILERFKKLLASGHLAHAYLLIGPRGVGKSETALAIAKLVNCEDPGESFCGQCPSCLKVASGNHPDVSLIDTGEESTIKVVRIRELIAKVSLRPYEGKKKIFIIKDAENLTIEGSNALLKTLEEPGKDNLLILTTAVPEKLLGTIKSRCHAVQITPCAPGRLAGYLREEDHLPEDEAQLLAYFSEGSPQRARRMKADGFGAFKNEIIDNIVFQRNNESYLKGLLADKDKTKSALEVLLAWFRDVTLLKTGIGRPQLINADRVKDLNRTEAQYTFKQLQEIIAQIVNTAKLLDENLNVKIPLSLLREKVWAKSLR